MAAAVKDAVESVVSVDCAENFTGLTKIVWNVRDVVTSLAVFPCKGNSQTFSLRLDWRANLLSNEIAKFGRAAIFIADQ